MIKDLTIGNYYPSDSLIHKLDPRTKLVLLLLIMIFIFIADNFFGLSVILLFGIAVLLATKIPLLVYLKNLKVVLPILIFTLLINVFYITDGAVVFEAWIFKITVGGISRSVFMAVRVILLILISSVLTYTTTPNDLTDGLERLFSPLRFIGLAGAVHSMAMMMTIALRFIPTLVDETQKIINAQKARGADFENGSLPQRVKAIIPIIIPLLISAVRRAYELAEAMESRCYNGGVGRTRMKTIFFKKADLFAFLSVFVWCGSIIALNILF